METWAVTNEAQARSWDGDEAAHWLVHEERYERMLAPFTGHLLTLGRPAPTPESVAGSSEVSLGGFAPALRPGRPQDDLGRRHRPHLDLTNHGRVP
jgi:hypothetical protein